MKKPEVDIRALASLARLEVGDDEIARLEREIPEILSFVETIQKTAGEAPMPERALRNVMRVDENPHESGRYTETLLAAAPAVKDGRIVVKQVVSRKAK